MFDYFVILITFGIVTLIKCCFSINLWETKVLKIKTTKRDLSVRQSIFRMLWISWENISEIKLASRMFDSI